MNILFWDIDISERTPARTAEAPDFDPDDPQSSTWATTPPSQRSLLYRKREGYVHTRDQGDPW